MGFRLVPKLVTLNDLERRNGRYFALFQRIRVASGHTASRSLSHLLMSSCFLAYSQQSLIGCLLHFHFHCSTHNVASSNLQRRSEMCCTRFAGNSLQDAKIGHLRTIAQRSRAMFSQLRHVSTIRKTAISPPYVLTI